MKICMKISDGFGNFSVTNSSVEIHFVEYMWFICSTAPNLMLVAC